MALVVIIGFFFTSLTILLASTGVTFGFQPCPRRFSTVRNILYFLIILCTVLSAEMAAVVAARLSVTSRCLVAGSRAWLSGVQRAGSWPKPGTARLYSSEAKVTVKFVNHDGSTIVAEGKVGMSLLDLVVEKNLDIDGFGACEGTLACSTCHLVFEDHIFQKLEPVTDEEMDMLDLAYGLTETSRLGCQICLQP